MYYKNLMSTMCAPRSNFTKFLWPQGHCCNCSRLGMGKKSTSLLLRLGRLKEWDSSGVPRSRYKEVLHLDWAIRKAVSDLFTEGDWLLGPLVVRHQPRGVDVHAFVCNGQARAGKKGGGEKISWARKEKQAWERGGPAWSSLHIPKRVPRGRTADLLPHGIVPRELDVMSEAGSQEFWAPPTSATADKGQRKKVWPRESLGVGKNLLQEQLMDAAVRRWVLFRNSTFYGRGQIPADLQGVVMSRDAPPSVGIDRRDFGGEERNSDDSNSFVSVPLSHVVYGWEKRRPELGAARLNVHIMESIASSAHFVSGKICMDLERRAGSPNSVMQRVIKDVLNNDMIKGIKVQIKGRLGGKEIASKSWKSEGEVPLQTMDEPVDYSFKEAYTPQGIVGVKVWITFKDGTQLDEGMDGEGGHGLHPPSGQEQGEPVRRRRGFP